MAKLLRDYGMVLVLIALCVLFSVVTIEEKLPTGEEAVEQLLEQARSTCGKSDHILVVGAVRKESGSLAETVGKKLRADGFANATTMVGSPRDLRAALDELKAGGHALAAIVTAGDAVKWRVYGIIPKKYPSLANYKLLVPESKRWPGFLTRSNLLAVVNRIVVIAVIAIGMTMVIITAGIDLSVGSLVALSAVTGTMVMKHLGGLDAPPWVVLAGFAAAMVVCGVVGGLGGLVVAWFQVPPFITTLSIMMMASGVAFMLTGGFSVYQVPDALTWLSHGRVLGVPNTVVLLVVLYLGAHVFMSQTRLGRYIYAVGGNPQAARLSGVPVKFIIVFVYAVCGLLAGLGGCIEASKLNTGTPNTGRGLELDVIAAVVVGGTSLAGGSGRIFGTLIGAFIISVIRNGMNLLGMESYTQKVVLGAVILAAVLLDKVRGGQGAASLFARVFRRKTKTERNGA